MAYSRRWVPRLSEATEHRADRADHGAVVQVSTGSDAVQLHRDRRAFVASVEPLGDVRGNVRLRTLRADRSGGAVKGLLGGLAVATEHQSDPRTGHPLIPRQPAARRVALFGGTKRGSVDVDSRNTWSGSQRERVARITAVARCQWMPVRQLVSGERDLSPLQQCIHTTAEMLPDRLSAFDRVTFQRRGHQLSEIHSGG